MEIQKVTSEQQLSKWAKLIQTRLESGQSIKEFCRTNGVSKATYYYWQKLTVLCCSFAAKLA